MRESVLLHGTSLLAAFHEEVGVSRLAFRVSILCPLSLIPGAGVAAGPAGRHPSRGSLLSAVDGGADGEVV